MIQRLPKKIKVMVFGTFDILHEGHKSFLEQARVTGDYLLVVLAREKTIKEVKKQSSINSEKKRLSAIEKSGLVNKVILGNTDDKYKIIAEHMPDIIALVMIKSFLLKAWRKS